MNNSEPWYQQPWIAVASFVWLLNTLGLPRQIILSVPRMLKNIHQFMRYFNVQCGMKLLRRGDFCGLTIFICLGGIYFNDLDRKNFLAEDVILRFSRRHAQTRLYFLLKLFCPSGIKPRATRKLRLVLYIPNSLYFNVQSRDTPVQFEFNFLIFSQGKFS